RNLSITPQPNAPWEPPPCNAGLIFLPPDEEPLEATSAVVSEFGVMTKDLELQRSRLCRRRLDAVDGNARLTLLAYCAVHPPSTGRAVPVMESPPWVHRNVASAPSCSVV